MQEVWEIWVFKEKKCDFLATTEDKKADNVGLESGYSDVYACRIWWCSCKRFGRYGFSKIRKCDFLAIFGQFLAILGHFFERCYSLTVVKSMGQLV